MADTVAGYGNIDFASAFAIKTDENLSSRLKFRAYDGDGTWPETGSAKTTAHAILKGTSENSWVSMVGLVSCNSARPGSSWFPTDEFYTTTNNPRRIASNESEATDYYVLQDTDALSISGGSALSVYNMCIEVPNDVQTSDNMQFDLEVEYSYTGTAPNITFMYNSGTIAVPVFSTITGAAGGEASTTRGVKHTRANSSSPDDLYANIPASGKEFTAEAWIVDANNL